MNAVAMRDAGTQPTRGQTVARTLASVDAKLLEPFRLYREQMESAWISVASRGRTDPVSAELVASPGRRGHDHAVNMLAERLTAIPQLAELKRRLAIVDAANAEPPDDRRSRALIGIMVDGFPNARPHQPEVYFEAMAHHARTFTPAVIAGACDQVTRTATFPPSVAEFLTMCETKAKELNATARYLQIAHDVREQAEAVAPSSPISG